MPRPSADQLRDLLAENAKLTARSGEHRAKINEAAHAELERVNARIDRLTGDGVLTTEVNAAGYRHAIMERARLHQLIGRGTRS